MRDAAEDMRRAAAGLQQQDPARASASAERALERLQQAEQSLRGSTPDARRRQLGDLQLETRQLADAERRVSRELDRAGQSPAGDDTRRKAAAEQERLAGRAERLERQLRDLRQQAGAGAERDAVALAAQELESERIGERMREAAKGVRGEKPSASAGSAATSSTNPPSAARDGAELAAGRAGADIARSLDKVAERLDAARTGDTGDTRRLSVELAQSRDLRERLEGVDRSLEKLSAHGRPREAEQSQDGSARGPARSSPAGRPAAGDRNGRSEEIASLQRQVADQLRETRERVDAMTRANPGMIGPSTPEEWQPSVSAPGTEAFKQDFARWESLKKNLLLALENVERSATSELRERETKDRLNAGASDAVPDEYRALVEKYYRSLAAPRRQER